MWSVKYTGYRSNIEDSFQRVSLHIDVLDFLRDDSIERLKRLIPDNLTHILLRFNLGIEIDLTRISSIISTLRDMTPKERKLIFTCEFFCDSGDVDMIYLNDALLALLPTFVIIRKTKSLHVTEDIIDKVNIIMVSNSIQNSCSIGISGFDDIENDLQLLVDNKRDIIKLVLFEIFQLPKIKPYQIDFIQSRGMNTMVILNKPNDEQNYQMHLEKYAYKYKKSYCSILGKIFLQLGSIISYDFFYDSEEFICMNILKLCHPYIHVGEYAAPTDKYSFIIDDEDINSLCHLANLEEIKLIEDALIHQISAPTSRMLTYSRVKGQSNTSSPSNKKLVSIPQTTSSIRKYQENKE